MNQQLWQQHLEERIGELERDRWRLRRIAQYQRERAEMWKLRALRKKAKS